MVFTFFRKTPFFTRLIQRSFFIFLLFAIFVSGVFVGGISQSSQTLAQKFSGKKNISDAFIKNNTPSDIDFTLFWEVWNYIQKYYVEQPVDKKKLFQGALAGSVAALNDPYSVYLNPETSEKFNQELAGSFDGIGAEIGIKKGVLTIIASLPDTPAKKAGLLSGDIILRIDEEDTLGMNLDYAISRIRGKRGTQIKLVVLHEGEKDVKEILITREKIVIKSVQLEILPENIAYVKLVHFSENSSEDFGKAVAQLLGKNIKGIILDVRNNPGGFLEDAIDIASFWIDNKVVVSERFSDGNIQSYRASGQPLIAHIPTVVLVNRGSASASEIVAAALKEYNKAVLVGEKTFGKGSVQDLQSFEDGSSVKLTIAKWLTPNGNEIDGVGITPDIEVPLEKEDYDKNQDPQYNKALEILEDKK